MTGKNYYGVWCEYSNLFNDCYRIEYELKVVDPFSTNPGKPANFTGNRSVKIVRERFYVLVEGRWCKTMDSNNVKDNIPILTIDAM